MKNLIKYFCILLCFNCFAQKEQKSLIGRWEHTKYISKHPKEKDSEEIMTKLLKGSILEYSKDTFSYKWKYNTVSGIYSYSPEKGTISCIKNGSPKENIVTIEWLTPNQIKICEKPNGFDIYNRIDETKKVNPPIQLLHGGPIMFSNTHLCTDSVVKEKHTYSNERLKHSIFYNDSTSVLEVYRYRTNRKLEWLGQFSKSYKFKLDTCYGENEKQELYPLQLLLKTPLKTGNWYGWNEQGELNCIITFKDDKITKLIRLINNKWIPSPMPVDVNSIEDFYW